MSTKRRPAAGILARLRAGAADDQGVALIFVIGVTSILLLLVATSLAYAIGQKPQARRDQDYNAAYAAAQAGVDDYIAKLNKTDNYWQALDCANPALGGAANAGVYTTNTCSAGFKTTTGWQPVKPGDVASGIFHVDIAKDAFSSQGVLTVTSTGLVGRAACINPSTMARITTAKCVARTVTARVGRQGSTQFVYYTDFEDADPGNTVPYPSGAPNDGCGKSGATSANYWYQTRSGCAEIQFAATDVLDGQVHFNDSPLIGGTAKFMKGFETADPNCTVALGKADSSGQGTSSGKGKCWRSTSTGLPYVYAAGAVPAARLLLDDTSDAFKNYPGCTFTGDTRIRFNNDGTMDVWNTDSVGTSILGPGTPAGTNCGIAANYKPSSDGITPASAQHVPVPDGLIIYVKNSPSSAVCQPGQVVNGSSSGSTATDVIPAAAGGSVNDITFFNPDSTDQTQTRTWTRSGSTWTGGTTSTGSLNSSGDDHQATFDCGQANLYIEGTVKGRLTLASENNIIVTNDLLLNSTSTLGATPSGEDIVGLVASNSVVIYHPVSRSSSSAVATTRTSGSATCPTTVSGTPTGTSGTSLTCQYKTTNTFGSTYTNVSYPGLTTSTGARYVYASIQTLAHSFYVQNYNRGADLGALSVRGSIAQKWRGAVGTSGGTGSDKDYKYDPRLALTSPPYFPAFVNAVWGSKATGEVKAAY
jgi:hypothetical protein